jgi:NAD(P)-dependent dehydrogenase (short-subunit alcohol dehydrogenase family)
VYLLRPTSAVHGENGGATITNVASGLGALADLADLRRRELADPGLTREGLAALMEECAAPAAEGWGIDASGVSKAALTALTRILAGELAPRRVNAPCPGWVRTEKGGGTPRGRSRKARRASCSA